MNDLNRNFLIFPLVAAIGPLLGLPIASQGAKLELTSNSRPLPPEYRIYPDRSVTLRICFNWSCSHQDTVTFQAADMAKVSAEMQRCPVSSQQERIQRVRVGIWQMQLVAQRYLPVLKNDREINDFDQDLEGRLDCVDSATNTGTYLRILSDMGLLDGWTPAEAEVRDVLDPQAVHWTAVLMDRATQTPWSVDSWFRAHGNLPYLLPLKSWRASEKGWEPPHSALNPYPQYLEELCSEPPPATEEPDGTGDDITSAPEPQAPLAGQEAPTGPMEQLLF